MAVPLFASAVIAYLTLFLIVAYSPAQKTFASRNLKERQMIRLGDKVRDLITGFEGIVTGHVVYISGCDQFLVAPRVFDGADLKSSHWFDQQRLEVMAQSVVTLDNGTTPGADEPAPSK